MTKQDFLNKLREALTGEVNADVINENIRFYDDYFMVEQRKGRTETEILEELGDPRLIARTIIDTSAAEDGAYRRTSYTEEAPQYENEEKTTGHVYRMPGWLLLLIFAVAIILVLFVVGSVVSFLLPVLVPILLICFIVGIIRRS